MIEIMSDSEMNDMVDRSFLRLFGKTYRTDPTTKQPIDSLAQIEHDFKDLFGGGKD